jgi:hypothetical protein
MCTYNMGQNANLEIISAYPKIAPQSPRLTFLMPSGFRCNATSFSGLTTGILNTIPYAIKRDKERNPRGKGKITPVKSWCSCSHLFSRQICVTAKDPAKRSRGVSYHVDVYKRDFEVDKKGQTFARSNRLSEELETF